MVKDAVGRVRDRLDAPAAALLLLLCGIWGIQQVAIKIANSGISPALQAGLRSAGAALLLWAWSSWRGVGLFERDGSLRAGLVAGLLFGGEFALLYWAIEFTTVSRTVIFLYTAPFTVAIGAHLFVPGEKLRGMQIAGLASAFTGVSLAFSEGLALPTATQLVGDAMALVAGAMWGATTIVVKASRLASISPNKTLFYQLAISAVMLVPLSWLLGETGITALTPLILGSLLFQTVIVAFATFLAWFWLIAHYPAGRISSFTFLTPLFGMIAGAVLLSEPISGLFLSAALLVGLGIWLVNRPPSKSAA